MAEKYLSETEIRKLLECCRCKRAPREAPVYVCRTGHLECSACFAEYSEVQKVDEADASTDSESDFAPNRKGDKTIGVIFPKDKRHSKWGPDEEEVWRRRNDSNKYGLIRVTGKSNHSCPICKEDILNTRNLLAENLIFHLEQAVKPVYQGTKQNVPDGNCVDCCYNIYGQAFPKYDYQGMGMNPYDPQRYHLSCGMQQYNYEMDQYLPQNQIPPLDYQDPNIFYPDFDDVSCCKASSSRRDLTGRKSRANFAPQPSLVSCSGEPSKRPIKCPTHLCGRNVAVTALTSHFCFDHPDVPPVSVDFDVTSHIFVAPDVIPFNYGRCVAVLLIPNRFESNYSFSHSNLLNSSKERSSLPLVVMASRLDCITNPQNSTNVKYDEINNKPESLSQGDFRVREKCNVDSQSKGATPPLENTKSPFLVIWLAGVEMNSSIFTTLQVTEKQTNVRSVVYTGPVTSLRSCQSTKKVFEQGDCLVIHPGILENIIGDRGGFDLHVVVH